MDNIQCVDMCTCPESTRDRITVVYGFITCVIFVVTTIAEVVLVTKTLTLRRAADLDEHDVCIKPGTCGEMPEVMHAYMDQTINARFDKLETDEENNRKAKESTKQIVTLKKYLKKSYWTFTPAARVIGDNTVKGTEICGNNVMCSSKLQPILRWMHTSRPRDFGVYFRYGIRYRDGRLVIPSNGTYHVYSYLNIHEPIPSTGNGRQGLHKPPLIHAIFKFNILDGTEIEIVSRTILRHESIGSENRQYNSYLSSVVELKTGDELVVMFSDVSLLTSPYLNYFGVNLV